MSKLYQMSEATAALAANTRHVQGLVRRLELKRAPGRGHFYQFTRNDLLALFVFDQLLHAGLNVDAARGFVTEYVPKLSHARPDLVLTVPVSGSVAGCLAVEVRFNAGQLAALLDQRLKPLEQQPAKKRGRPRQEALAEFLAVGQEIGEALAKLGPETMAKVEARERAKKRRGVQNFVNKLKARG